MRKLLESFRIPDKEKELIIVIAKRIIEEKEKIMCSLLEEKKNKTKNIESEMERIKKSMLLLREPTLIAEYEKERMLLNNNKNEVEESMKILEI
ncbi:TPA: hypothetical protein DEP21_00785 [Patescibacteria group bacterium]|nr:hypothetical protein [Candidatus Gracilibacteria bacterium]